jgi:hypothetical protein
VLGSVLGLALLLNVIAVFFSDEVLLLEFLVQLLSERQV